MQSLAPAGRCPTALTLPAPCAGRSPRPSLRAALPGLLGPGPAAGLLGAGGAPERPEVAERSGGRRSVSAAAAARRPAPGTAGPAALAAAAGLAPPLLLPATSAVLGAPAPWRPPTEPARCFGFLSANLCLLPDGLARFSNLQHGQRRAEAVGAVLLAGLRPSRYGTTGCSPPGPGAPCGMLIAAVPAGLDFVCLQEVFDLRAARRLVSRLAPNLGPVLYNVGTFGLQPGPHLKLLGSGLLLASRYPLLRAAFWSFPHGRREDALASKGLLSAQVHLGILDGRRIVGFLHCTHLHAPSEDGPLRCKQLTLLLDWAEQFEAESRQGDDAVAFSVLLGDLNFDNCSPDHAQEQEHQLFSRFRDPCRLAKRREQPWALGTILNTSMLCHSVACSPEMLRRALEQEEGRHRYLAGPPRGGHRAKPWRGRRLDYITYRGVPGGPLNPEVEQVTFSTALAGLTDHLAVGLRLRVSMSS